MIKILKSGEKYGYRLKCSKCHCVFIATEDECRNSIFPILDVQNVEASLKRSFILKK